MSRACSWHPSVNAPGINPGHITMLLFWTWYPTVHPTAAYVMAVCPQPKPLLHFPVCLSLILLLIRPPDLILASSLPTDSNLQWASQPAFWPQCFALLFWASFFCSSISSHQFGISVTVARTLLTWPHTQLAIALWLCKHQEAVFTLSLHGAHC